MRGLGARRATLVATAAAFAIVVLVATEPARSAPDDSAKAYAAMRQKLDTHMAHMELEEAKKILDDPPAELSGQEKANLEDDRAAEKAIDAVFQLALANLKKTGTGEQTFTLWAQSKKLTCRIRKIEGNDITYNVIAGYDQTMKVSDIETDELCALARKDLPKDQRESYLLGRGLILYYSGDDAKAKKSFQEKELAQNSCAQAFLARIARDPARQAPDSSSGQQGSGNQSGSGNASGQGSKSETKKEDDPASRDLTADLANLRAMLHVNPSSDGNGRVGLRYKFGDDAECADFQGSNTEMCERDTRSGKGLVISAASQQGGWVTLKPNFKGDFTIVVTTMTFGANSGSDLVFFCGFNGKKATGAKWTGEIVELDASGNSRPKGGGTVDVDKKFRGNSTNTFKLVREGTRVTYWLDGLQLGQPATMPATEGKAGIYVYSRKVTLLSYELSAQLGDNKKK